MYNEIKGIGSSKGIGIGQIYVHQTHTNVIVSKKVDDSEKEITKLNNAISKSKDELTAIYEKKVIDIGKENAEIFNAHKMILEDPQLMNDILTLINTEKINAESAVDQVKDKYMAFFGAMEDEYFKERAHDIKDVCTRVINNITGNTTADLSMLKKGTILCAKDLTPSDTAQLNKENIIGIVTALGGKTSHTAIISRTLGIPALMGIGEQTFEKLVSKTPAIIDADRELLILNPDEKLVTSYEIKIEEAKNFRELLKQYIGKPSITLDGKHIEISANIAKPTDVTAVLENDADGIGLFRSEFIFLDKNSPPSEEEQFEAYSTVLKDMDSKPVIIRTMDIGGDKNVDYLNFDEEMNPFLGHRAVRFCFDNPAIFKTQLRALYRASIYGNLRIMIPMISNVSEIRKVKEIINEVTSDLDKENISYQKVPLGIMIEIPSAAICSDLLAKEVDFFSIGTNDLVQYTVAVDRMNEKISDLYTPFHPAVLRLINMTIQNAHKNNIWVGMCGSAAGNTDLIPLLLGMGLDEFSMSPVDVLLAKKIILESDQSALSNKVDEILNLSTIEEVKTQLKKF